MRRRAPPAGSVMLRQRGGGRAHGRRRGGTRRGGSRRQCRFPGCQPRGPADPGRTFRGPACAAGAIPRGAPGEAGVFGGAGRPASRGTDFPGKARAAADRPAGAIAPGAAVFRWDGRGRGGGRRNGKTVNRELLLVIRAVRECRAGRPAQARRGDSLLPRRAKARSRSGRSPPGTPPAARTRPAPAVRPGAVLTAHSGGNAGTRRPAPPGTGQIFDAPAHGGLRPARTILEAPPVLSHGWSPPAAAVMPAFSFLLVPPFSGVPARDTGGRRPDLPAAPPKQPAC